MAKKFKQYSGWFVAVVFGLMLLADDKEKQVLEGQPKSLTVLQQEPTATQLDKSNIDSEKPIEFPMVNSNIKNRTIKQVTPIVSPILKSKPTQLVETKPIKLVSSLPKQSKPKKSIAPKINSPLGFKYISKKSVNVRAKPTTKSAKVGNLKLGTKITYISIDKNWFEIEMPKTNKVGWIRGDLLANNKPKPKLFVPVVAKTLKRTGPIRAPYYGKCDCPYDRTTRGSRCGGRSAYSRPGGRSPRCYF